MSTSPEQKSKGPGERLAESWGRYVAQHSRIALWLGLLVFAAMAAGAFRLQMALSVEDYLMKDDPARVVYDELRHSFDTDEAVLVLVDGDVFSPAFLERLKALHEALETRVPGAERVESLVNARVTQSDAGSLIVADWLDTEPADASARPAWTAAARENPTYRNLLVSADGLTAALTVLVGRPGSEPGADAVLSGFGESAPERASERLLLEPQHIEAIMRAVDAIVREFRAPGFDVSVTGGPAMTYAIAKALEHDMGVFTVGALLVVGVLLWLLFGRLSGVLLPMGVATLAMAATFGVMGWLGLPVTPTTQILPSLLLAVGVAQGVHPLTAFYRAHDSGLNRVDAIAAAFGHSGVAVALASLTTAIGLGAFVTSSLPPLYGLGYAAIIGVTSTFVAGFVLLPAALARVPIARGRPAGRLRTGVDGLVARIGVAAARRPGPVLAGWALVSAVAISGAVQLEVRNDALGWFPDDHPFSSTTRRADRALGGTFPLTIAIDTGRPGRLLEPALLGNLERFEREALGLEVGEMKAGASVSLISIVKETHRTLSDGDPHAYVIPNSRELLAQELLLFESAAPEELDDFVDTELQRARMTLMVPMVDNRKYVDFADALSESAARLLPDAEVTITGVPILSARSNAVITDGMLRSYGTALLLIAPLMMLLARDVRIGALAMLPNLAPIAIGLGLMRASGIDLDAFTITIASIAIGMAVDDTIHFVHGWARAYNRSGCHVSAVGETLQSTGSALLTTSAALAGGFAVFAAAEMTNVVHFGLVTFAVVVVAFFADIQLFPALLSLVSVKYLSRARGRDRTPQSIRALDTWTPLPAAERRSFTSHYLEYLKRRNGRPDFEHQTSSLREAYQRKVEGIEIRSRDGASLIDRRVFERLQLRDLSDERVDDRTLWAICTANANYTEQFGVEYGLEVLSIRPGEPLSWIMIEERYHTRLLVDCAEALGAKVRRKEPRRRTALLVMALSRMPHWIMDPLILSTEVIALTVFRQLLRKAEEIFADERVAMRRIGAAYRQIIVDEIGHVRNLHAKLGRIRLALARALTVPIARIYLGDLPEVTRLLGRHALLAELRDVVSTGAVEVGDGSAHPLDVLTGHRSAAPGEIERAIALT